MEVDPVFDLVLRGGRVIDPARRIDGLLDVGISEGRIARVGPNLAPAHGREWVDAAGKIIVPGLIDIHAHVYPYATFNGIEPDLAGVHSGVTTVVDAGSAGSATFEGFRHHVVDRARTTVLAHLHIARNGLNHIPEALSTEEVDFDATVATIKAFPEIVGVKVRACGPPIENEGLAMIELAAGAAREAGVRLMVHIGDAHFGRSAHITRELLPLLAPGDVLTHVFTGAAGRGLDEESKVLPELVEARDRGVILDAAHGRRNLSFAVARSMMEQGVVPSIISTDLTKPGRGVAGSMTHTMGRFLALGFSLGEVVEMSTLNPAIYLGVADEVGTLAEGTVADIAVLEPVTGPWWYGDAEDEWIEGDEALRPVLTIRAGQRFAPDYGPFPGGWLPHRGRP